MTRTKFEPEKNIPKIHCPIHEREINFCRHDPDQNLKIKFKKKT